MDKSVCGACGNLGWWCCGCGGQSKISAMLAAGFTQSQADNVYHGQFGSCGEYFPCILCNRNGDRLFNSECE